MVVKGSSNTRERGEINLVDTFALQEKAWLDINGRIDRYAEALIKLMPNIGKNDRIQRFKTGIEKYKKII